MGGRGGACCRPGAGAEGLLAGELLEPARRPLVQAPPGRARPRPVAARRRGTDGAEACTGAASGCPDLLKCVPR